MPALPDLPPFNALAVDLKLYADSAVMAVHAGDVLRARGGWGGGFNQSLDELRKAAEASGAVYGLMRWMGARPEREQLIRDFFAGIDAEEPVQADDRQRSAG